ncbi:small kinetochore-associated protein [Pseudoliparis swirei]|uniref:small kinetochore-associated protein n=1 Tax=Pseudoliparis swirei TaxID=2059687 RepID=UPI0024BDD4C0|nr:small kinetochore-associated protein [Pseudoliparis swirei]XP_056284461.1 small kinetochore-associated protein [Pseudoliparis swirei]
MKKMSSRIPRSLQLPAEIKKAGYKVESKETAAVSATAHAGQKSDGILKPQKENVPKKAVAPKVNKGISTRYGQQADLKGQNQHLMATNEELQKNLTETQQRVATLELQVSELKTEAGEVQKNLKDCHMLLVAANIDPVLGERVGEAAQQKEDKWKGVMSVFTDLLNELKVFGDTASQQHVCLEEIQTTMTGLSKAREHMMQERENFSLQVVEMENALKEAEALLL